MNPILEVNHLKTYYQQENSRVLVRAVDNLSFKAHEGEIFAITGPSGSGKSTIARSLMGLVRGYPGVVDIDLRFKGNQIIQSCPVSATFGKMCDDEVISRIKSRSFRRWNRRFQKEISRFYLKNGLLFSIDSKFQSDLDNGNSISEELQGMFKYNGILLSQNASIEKEYKRWLITDKNNEQKYTVRKEKNQLNIYENGKLDSSIIFQEPVSTLNPYIPLWKQVAECIRLRDRENKPLREYKKKVIELLDRVQFPNPKQYIDTYSQQLSVGMCQRVVLAMAIGSGARFIIADEPTAKVDPQTREEIIKLIKKENFAMLLITHDLDVIKKLADRVAVLERGKIAEQGAVTDVVSNPQKTFTKKLVNAYFRRHLPEVRECSDSLCRIENVRKTFRRQAHPLAPPTDVEVLKGVSLEIPAGSRFALVGESGCGKTTLARILCGLIRQTSGKILYSLRGKQEPIDSLLSDRSFFKCHVQIIFQEGDVSLDPGATTIDCLSEAYRLHYPFLNRRERRILSQEILKDVQLGNLDGNQYPHMLSGGERKRVMIARTLIAIGYLGGDIIAKSNSQTEYRFLIADEPDSGLDGITTKEIIEGVLLKYADKLNITLLLISHNLRFIKSVATHIAIMREGKIIEYGKSNEILKNPRNDYTKCIVSS